VSNPQRTHPMSTWSELEADKAFRQASRARRRAAVVARLRRGARLCGLTVFDETRRSGPRSGRGVREIPLDAIKGTTEPNRAAQFDQDFRPSKLTRSRWQSVWLAFHRGATLPPISVVPVRRCVRDPRRPSPRLGREGARRAQHPRDRRGLSRDRSARGSVSA
jgi:hypothetical protein